MLTTLSWIFAQILPHLPELEIEAETLFNAIAHGEGGTEKIGKVAASLGKLAETAGGIAVAVSPPAPVTPETPPTA